MEKAKVFFTKQISSESLLKLYDLLQCELQGNVAVKISTGEPGGHHFLSPDLIKDLVHKVNGTIVECCTAYNGKRDTLESHLQVIKDHGFMDIAPCDILDGKEEIELPITNSKYLKGVNIVGANIKKYQSALILSHFKGHAMGGFGGALKNISIGFASRNGKAWIHTAGITKDPKIMWNHVDNQDAFLESMAEASKSIIDFFKKKNMVYINILNNLSIDCDCDSNPAKPEIEDIGILASLDPVALDQCSYDEIINLNDSNKESLVNRMKEKNAIHLLEEAERLELGTRNYEKINID